VKLQEVSTCNFILTPSELDEAKRRDLWAIWKSYTPFKLKKKSWQLLLHRFPTRDNLAKRDVINVVSEAGCIWFKFEEGQIIEYHLW
jgi:hypothetical protein